MAGDARWVRTHGNDSRMQLKHRRMRLMDGGEQAAECAADAQGEHVCDRFCERTRDGECGGVRGGDGA
jgi:hypothetical protein